MRRLYYLLLLLLFISVLNIVYGETIGPGVDPLDPSSNFVYIGNGVYSVYPKGDLYIEFQLPYTGNYDFFLGWGIYENPTGGLLFQLKDLNGNIIAQKYVSLEGQDIEFHTDYLFTVNLAAGTYRLWIRLVRTSEASFSGTLKLLGYPVDKDASTTYYYDPLMKTWVTFDYDIGWYAYYYSEGGGEYKKPVFIINSIQFTDKVYLSIELGNFKPNSAITIGYVDTSRGTAQAPYREYVTTVNVDSYGNWSGVISVGSVKAGDYLIAIGYDQYDNYVEIMSQIFNETLVPPGWLDIVYTYLTAIVSAIRFVYAVVSGVIPYIGVFYFLALLGAFFTCIKEVSLSPLYDFFYKQYTALISFVNLAIKIAEKIYQAGKTIVEWLVRIATFIAALLG